jgi:hypothetical protein
VGPQRCLIADRICWRPPSCPFKAQRRSSANPLRAPPSGALSSKRARRPKSNLPYVFFAFFAAISFREIDWNPFKTTTGHRPDITGALDQRRQGAVRGMSMTVTLDEIHHDPGIIDRAIINREPLDITSAGHVAATLIPAPERPSATRRPFDGTAHRAWLARTWGEREFMDEEIQEMRAAQDRQFGE